MIGEKKSWDWRQVVDAVGQGTSKDRVVCIKSSSFLFEVRCYRDSSRLNLVLSSLLPRRCGLISCDSSEYVLCCLDWQAKVLWRSSDAEYNSISLFVRGGWWLADVLWWLLYDVLFAITIVMDDLYKCGDWLRHDGSILGRYLKYGVGNL